MTTARDWWRVNWTHDYSTAPPPTLQPPLLANISWLRVEDDTLRRHIFTGWPKTQDTTERWMTESWLKITKLLLAANYTLHKKQHTFLFSSLFVSLHVRSGNYLTWQLLLFLLFFHSPPLITWILLHLPKAAVQGFFLDFLAGTLAWSLCRRSYNHSLRLFSAKMHSTLTTIHFSFSNSCRSTIFRAGNNQIPSWVAQVAQVGHVANCAAYKQFSSGVSLWCPPILSSSSFLGWNDVCGNLFNRSQMGISKPMCFKVNTWKPPPGKSTWTNIEHTEPLVYSTSGTRSWAGTTGQFGIR